MTIPASIPVYHRPGRLLGHAVAAALLLSLCVASMTIGVGSVSWLTLMDPMQASDTLELLRISRIPRTLALILAGTAMAVAGLIMQMLVQNRFVEPSTAGTVESATFGMLLIMLLAPGLPVFVKMLIATVFALAGTSLFLLILRRVPPYSPFLVPVIGLILAGVVQAVTTFIAYQYDLVQSLQNWMVGDFSGVLKGRYELLWTGFLLTLGAYFLADRFTVIGMGEQFTTNLGLQHKRLTALGLAMVSAISAVVVVSVGTIPFLGLLVPNVVSLYFGDNLRRAIPWVAYLGASFVLACDILARVIYYPYEIPIGVVIGVAGSVLFLYLLLNKRVSLA